MCKGPRKGRGDPPGAAGREASGGTSEAGRRRGGREFCSLKESRRDRSARKGPRSDDYRVRPLRGEELGKGGRGSRNVKEERPLARHRRPAPPAPPQPRGSAPPPPPPLPRPVALPDSSGLPARLRTPSWVPARGSRTRAAETPRPARDALRARPQARLAACGASLRPWEHAGVRTPLRGGHSVLRGANALGRYGAF